MARINVEEAFWSDPRFLRLCIKLGDEAKAIGCIILAWRVAQKYWCPDMKLIPKLRWDQLELCSALFEVGLAEERNPRTQVEHGSNTVRTQVEHGSNTVRTQVEHGSNWSEISSNTADVGSNTTEIYVNGTREAFDWYFKAREKGQKSVNSRRSKSGTAQPKPKKSPNRVRTQVEHKSNTAQLSSNTAESGSNRSEDLNLYSSLSSSSLAETQKTEDPLAPLGGESPSVTPLVLERTDLFLKTYIDAWKRVYKTRPPITQKVVGIASRVVKDLGTERACAYVETFLTMADQWYLTKRHDLGTFEQHLGAVAQMHDTGQGITRKQAQAVETGHSNANVGQRYLARTGGDSNG